MTYHNPVIEALGPYTKEVAAISADILAAVETKPLTADQITAAVGRKFLTRAGVSAWHYVTRRGLIKYQGPAGDRLETPVFGLTSQGDAALAAYRSNATT